MRRFDWNALRVGDRVVWPSLLAAHDDPPDPTEDCWRCAALAATAERLLVAPAVAPAATR